MCSETANKNHSRSGLRPSSICRYEKRVSVLCSGDLVAASLIGELCRFRYKPPNLGVLQNRSVPNTGLPYSFARPISILLTTVARDVEHMEGGCHCFPACGCGQQPYSLWIYSASWRSLHFAHEGLHYPYVDSYSGACRY
jgi:hypothetical protein